MNLDAILAIATAPRRDSKRWSQDTITWGELLAWVDHPARVKECGNYLLGTLSSSTRSKATVVSRSAITLDADKGDPGLPERMELVFPYAALGHDTYSSSPDDPRYRIILPADREMTPDEYRAVSEVLMDQLGREQFDEGSVQPERYMFMPAAQHLEWFQSWVIDGPPVPVDLLLKDWTPDLSRLAEPRANVNKRDPFELEGVIGAFNRAYGIELAIETYDLPYEPAGELRWHLVGAHAEAGMNQVSEGLFYSHHSTDPASGQTSSVFDLVRLHRFGELDANVPEQTPINQRPSQLAMMDLAGTDSRVVAELVGVDFAKEMDDAVEDSSWKLKLRLATRTGKFIDCIENWDLVRKHSSVFQGLYFNELSMAVESEIDLPWRPLAHGGPVFTGTDRAAFCHFLERVFHIRPPRALLDEFVDTTAQQHYVNPIRDYLLSLTWDGSPRVEVCLPGVAPTVYTRLVARKALVAAVARILEPGVKWDHSLVLFGPEGIGKSWWISRMARGYSATLGRIGDKDTLLTMQRSWIMISDEGYSLRKADADVQKEFLTRTEDVFRLPYERESIVHKRHCVIWGTTNDEVFLRRQEGNRRFLIVRCDEKVNFDVLTDHYIAQVWAEAVALYQAGERLFLEEGESEIAAVEREAFTEEDALAGVLGEFLDTPVPEDWEDMGPDARSLWMQNRADGLVQAGTKMQTRTCSAQLWVEAMGRRFGEHHRTDLLDINSALKRIPGWEALPGRHRVPYYGTQLVFERGGSLASTE